MISNEHHLMQSKDGRNINNISARGDYLGHTITSIFNEESKIERALDATLSNQSTLD